ncbi:peroxidase superfamily protein [Actinidia rufa]|uniref:Peroxidase superfamily protein n=1 Tax=Actinidia rufa TaxID=165716 RepID=A0A7J0EPH4_9ERIC|nr:peroxidase superfamily protein [Actinidia rufa]
MTYLASRCGPRRGGDGGKIVFSAQADAVVGAADHVDEVAGGDGEDVGAGDDAGAVELDGGLDAGDEVESVAGKGAVDVGVAEKAVGETRTDASQPSMAQSWKKRRSVAEAVVWAEICLSAMTCSMILRRLGQVLL